MSQTNELPPSGFAPPMTPAQTAQIKARILSGIRSYSQVASGGIRSYSQVASRVSAEAAAQVAQDARDKIDREKTEQALRERGWRAYYQKNEGLGGATQDTWARR